MGDLRQDAWCRAAPADAVPQDAPLVVAFEGREIAIYRVGDEYFATSNICTHGLARLSDGYLDGYLIECPMHQGVFDIRDGSCAAAPVEEELKTYQVRVLDGYVEVKN
jgi:naphthalene 1,2-dioxygenase system ferredoxin subunit